MRPYPPEGRSPYRTPDPPPTVRAKRDWRRPAPMAAASVGAFGAATMATVGAIYGDLPDRPAPEPTHDEPRNRRTEYPRYLPPETMETLDNVSDPILSMHVERAIRHLKRAGANGHAPSREEIRRALNRLEPLQDPDLFRYLGSSDSAITAQLETSSQVEGWIGGRLSTYTIMHSLREEWVQRYIQDQTIRQAKRTLVRLGPGKAQGDRMLILILGKLVRTPARLARPGNAEHRLR